VTVIRWLATVAWRVLVRITGGGLAAVVKLSVLPETVP
jgi:hypothetical protein